MLAPKPPIEMLVDTIVHKPYKGEGDYNKPEYGSNQTINHVRIDRSPQYSFGPGGKEWLGNAKVFCYYGLTAPLPDFKELDVLTIDGKERVITSASMFKEPYLDQIYSWELVVK